MHPALHLDLSMLTSPPILVVHDASGEVLRAPFAGLPLIVGRSSEAPVRLDDGMVSRQHAEIRRDANGAYQVRDLQSRNGTFVDGLPIVEKELGPGETIQIGPFTLSIEDPAWQGKHDPRQTTTRLILSDTAGGRISTLQDLGAARLEVAHLTALNELSQKLLETPSPRDRAELLCQVMVGPQFRGQWGVIVRIALRSQEDRPQLLHEAYSISNREPYLSRSVLRKVRETGQAVLAGNAAQRQAPQGEMMLSVAVQVVEMAAVACPIGRTAETLDLLYVMLPAVLGSAEWLALVTLAVKQYQQAESAWAARKQAESLAAVERELAHARQIQMRLVPRETGFQGIEVAIGFVPCRWVGGDYVDAVQLADGRTLLAIADVCGKGLPAALVASSVHTMVHAGVLANQHLCELMNNLNVYLGTMLSGESFVTMIAVIIEVESGRMEVVNAGHPPPLVVAGQGTIRRIEMQGNLPLGMDPAPMALNTFHLAHDEMLVLYSDGLSELRGEDGMFVGIGGLEREMSAITCAGHWSPCEAAKELSGRLNFLQGGDAAVDDRTFLLARRVPHSTSEES